MGNGILESWVEGSIDGKSKIYKLLIMLVLVSLFGVISASEEGRFVYQEIGDFRSARLQLACAKFTIIGTYRGPNDVTIEVTSCQKLSKASAEELAQKIIEMHTQVLKRHASYGTMLTGTMPGTVQIVAVHDRDGSSAEANTESKCCCCCFKWLANILCCVGSKK